MGEIKKDKHGQHCYDQRKHFSLFSPSVDRMMGKESLVILSIVSRLMAAKMDGPNFHVKVWVNDRIVIAVARSYSRVLYGAQAPSSLRTRELDWASGPGLSSEH